MRFILASLALFAALTAGVLAAPPVSVLTVSGTRGPLAITGRSDFEIRFEPHAKIVGSGSGPDGILLVNCRNVRILGPSGGRGTIARLGRGIRLVNCRNVTIERLYVTGNGRGTSVWGGPGLLTVQCAGVTVRDSVFSHNAGHGAYFSDSTDGIVFERNEMFLNGSTGLQINAIALSHAPGRLASNDGWSDGCVIRDNRSWRNAAGMNLMGLRGSLVAGNWLANSPAGITLWNNGRWGWGSRGNRFEGNIVASTGRAAYLGASDDCGTAQAPNVLAGSVWIGRRQVAANPYNRDGGGNRRFASLAAAAAAGSALPDAFKDLALR